MGKGSFAKIQDNAGYLIGAVFIFFLFKSLNQPSAAEQSAIQAAARGGCGACCILVPLLMTVLIGGGLTWLHKSGKIKLPLGKLPFCSKSEASAEESAEAATKDDDKDDAKAHDTPAQATPEQTAPKTAKTRDLPSMGGPAAQDGIPTWIWILGIGVVVLFLIMGCVFIFMFTGDDDDDAYSV